MEPEPEIVTRLRAKVASFFDNPFEAESMIRQHFVSADWTKQYDRKWFIGFCRRFIDARQRRSTSGLYRLETLQWDLQPRNRFSGTVGQSAEKENLDQRERRKTEPSYVYYPRVRQ